MKYVLFGAGRRGASYYDKYKDKYDIVCFADSDPLKQGTNYMSLDVISPGEIAQKALLPIVTIKCKDDNARMEIMKQLFDAGVKELYFPRKEGLEYFDFTPYDSLDEKPNKVCVLGIGNTGEISKALYMYNPFPDIDVVMINSSTKNSDYYYGYITSSLIITHCIEPCKGKKSIELWHGFTIKSLFYMANSKYDRDIACSKHLELVEKDAICSLSKLYSIFFGYCSNIDYDKMRITGYPRNDMLLVTDGRKNLETIFGIIKYRHIILYMPTYRVPEESKKGINGKDNSLIFDMPSFRLDEFSEYLERNDILFIYKLHSAQKKDKNLPKTGNMKEITDKMLLDNDLDLYEILNAADCLISDYSSVIIDFLLTDKPIILTPLDLEEYAETRGFMTEPYDAWMPGDIALDYPQLVEAISRIIVGNDFHKDYRHRLKKITHKYTDAKSSERVLELARDILGIGQ